MIISVLIRRLREGKDFEDFKRAWYPEVGFGVPTRVLAGVNLEDPREIVTVGFTDVAEDRVAEMLAGQAVAAENRRRHQAIDAVIESFPVRAGYLAVDDQDFTGTPRPFGGGPPGAGITPPPDPRP
jgi:hypothetical protein